ncbi:MAG: Lyzozyme M1 (1,4-beta-N-acetylmuramidase), partial [Ruminococcus sp.]|nr:Lyzozyme M1 (1,4-beta-N-acetylmuramidase) [Ruminococcus sp.]
ALNTPNKKGSASKENITKKKSIDTIAREVINGKWGNGADRKKRLLSAGYDYNAVQKRVNELLR